MVAMATESVIMETKLLSIFRLSPSFFRLNPSFFRLNPSFFRLNLFFQTKSLSVTAEEFGAMLMGEHDQIVAAFQEKIPLPIKLRR